MKSTLMMKTPASWHGDMWREGAPCGNGKIGALVYGSVDREYILLNHTRLWRAGTVTELPDIHESLAEVRRLLDAERPDLADGVLAKALSDKGYNAHTSSPYPLCDIRITRASEKPVYGYRRTVDFQTAEVTVRWEEDDAVFERKTFVSRSDDLCYTKISCSAPGKISVTLGLDAHDTETMPSWNALKNPAVTVKDGCIRYSADNETAYVPAQGSYGAVMRVHASGGTVLDGEKTVSVTSADEVLLVTALFVGGDRAKGLDKCEQALDSIKDYDAALAEHIPLHRKLYDGVQFRIAEEGAHTSAEEMLLDAYGNGASDELIETLYAYGRYLFVCSTGTPEEDVLPTHLVGLWNGTYQCFWAFHMFNVNFEMIYWQALTGNQPGLLRTALDYVESMTEDFRENARKIFGCRGIYLDSVNTPESGKIACTANHILNWTAGAAWVAEHFYDYGRCTGDRDYLVNHALPFMAEAALFYEDFLYVGKDGRYEFSPSVSPENTAKSVTEKFASAAETSKNAAMDIAAVRGLLTNLLEASALTGLYAEKRAKWGEMLSLLPDYRYNEDGSLKEWADDFYTDQNSHRHHSHLYGVFPGHSVTPGTKEYDACVLAEDKRFAEGLKAQSSWSMVYAAGVNARLGRGDKALFALSEMVRVCCMGNLFTVHNDWRRTGSVSCDDFRVAPFQIDANIGLPAVVNEMLVQSADGDVVLLPALPQAWKKGEISGLLTVGGHRVALRWTEDRAEAMIESGFSGKLVLRTGGDWRFEDGSDRLNASLPEGESLSVRLVRCP